MYEENLGLLRDEAQRILKQEIKLLEVIQNAPGILTETVDTVQTFDPKTLARIVDDMQDEEMKLNNLEFVLAVVGTMKAGKSTTINAIVGVEVLPNRNGPMTVLPTLIRHVPGVKNPRLIFKNINPINTLIGQLSERLLTAPKELVGGVMDAEDTSYLIERLNRQEPFTESYEGAKEIFTFLKELNDLARLSTVLDVDFPFESYISMESLPLIEVEFYHLKEMNDMQGSLTLLDTPGPNEAGQTHLRSMLNDQLKKASAVLAVLDYTQLQSDADSELREQLNDVAKLTGDRLHVLINRFDQRDRNSDSADSVRKKVAQTLIKDFNGIERVHAVSAKYAYLASHAKNELELHGKLPDYRTHEWVQDFACIGIGGRRWESLIDDIDEVKAAADYLWEESGFNTPVNNIIRDAYSKTMVLALDSVSSKMLDLAENSRNFLGVREQAFKKSVEQLEVQVKSLQENIIKIEDEEASVLNDIKTALDSVSQYINKTGDLAKKEALSNINKYFEECGYENTVDFERKKDAENLVKRIESSVDKILVDTEVSLQVNIENKIEAFHKKLEKSINKSSSLIKSINEGMDDFNLSISLPSVEGLSVSLNVSHILRNSTVEKGSKKPDSRRQDGVWGSVCSWFGTDDWGWEEYQRHVRVYSVDINKTKNDIEDVLGRSFLYIENILIAEIERELIKEVESFFSILNETLVKVRGDLMTSIEDRKKTRAQQDFLLRELVRIRRPISNILEDSYGLIKDVKNILREGDLSYE